MSWPWNAWSLKTLSSTLWFRISTGSWMIQLWYDAVEIIGVFFFHYMDKTISLSIIIICFKVVYTWIYIQQVGELFYFITLIMLFICIWWQYIILKFLDWCVCFLWCDGAIECGWYGGWFNFQSWENFCSWIFVGVYQWWLFLCIFVNVYYNDSLFYISW